MVQFQFVSSNNLELYRNQLCQFRRQIIHCHLFPYLDFSNCIYVIRDPRDVYLSLYHHYFLMGDPGALWIGDILCQELKINDPSNVRKNIGRFIKRMCLNPPYPRFTLKDYLRALKNTSYVATTTYEALRCNTSKELKKLLQSLQVILPKESRIEKSICKFEFKNRKANARGIEQRFLRKGIVGDWRSVYDLDACNITKQYLGDLLIELGYEKDHEW